MTEENIKVTNDDVITKRGLHNWRRLLKKPDSKDYVILFMLIMGILMSYAYRHETQQCRDTLATLDVTACQICSANRIIMESNSLKQNATDLYLQGIGNISLVPSSSGGNYDAPS